MKINNFTKEYLKENGFKIKEMEYQKERKIEVLVRAKYKNYEFIILNLGTHPTAYVNVPVGHPYYFKNYDDIDIDVHGGITYSRNYLYTDKETKIEGWFIGWDYAHWDDYMGYYIDDEILSKMNDKIKKWTTDEIIQECLNVIDQLEKVKYEVK